MWKSFSTELLSRQRHKVTVPLLSSEVCCSLEFFRSSWWGLPHLSPGYWAGVGEQLFQACQLTSASREKAGARWVFPVSTWQHAGKLRAPLPMWVSATPFLSVWGSWTHQGSETCWISFSRRAGIFFINLVPWHQTLWFLLLSHIGSFMSIPEINSRSFD